MEKDQLNDGLEDGQSEDPINLYNLLNKKHPIVHDIPQSVDEPKYPPGFTPQDTSEVNSNMEPNSNREGNENIQTSHGKVKEPAILKKASNSKTKENGDVSLCSGHFQNVGNKNGAGGVLCVWDSNMFRKGHATVSDYFIAIMGKWVPNDKNLLIISVYAPLELSEKKMLWQYLNHMIDRWNGEVIVIGDFNEVRSQEERFSSIFNIVIYLTTLLRESSLDYGPTLFRFYHYWFEIDGFDSFVAKTWRDITCLNLNPMLRQKKKLAEIDSTLDKGEEDADNLEERMNIMTKFSIPGSDRLILDMEFPNKLSIEQKTDLERPFTKEEIKGAVWDCGLNKSPGPDGFTFGFYQRYWNLLAHDIVEAVNHFFTHGFCSKGCNSSFIALIPKTHDSKLVKDFRPISLIGSLYKIIANILANRLVIVMGNLVNEVQSAFIENRQILDGPFILNEVIQWCKAKKKQSMIFKVDFEKAFDSFH
ncbi:RNA-directed DNA polymerase, eukaryota, reverse transcriptase zinc-binding domain protein [Tanacetum coccineum]